MLIMHREMNSCPKTINWILVPCFLQNLNVTLQAFEFKANSIASKIVKNHKQNVDTIQLKPIESCY